MPARSTTGVASRDDRHARLGTQLAVAFEVSVEQRGLEPGEPERLEPPGGAGRLIARVALLDVEHQRETFARHGPVHRLDHRNIARRLAPAVELDRREALLQPSSAVVDIGLCVGQERCAGIGRYTVPCAAQELVEGQFGELAGHVPERDVDQRHRLWHERGVERAQAIPQRLALERRPARDFRQEVAERLGDRTVEGMRGAHGGPRHALEAARRGELQDRITHELLGHLQRPGVALGLGPYHPDLGAVDGEIAHGSVLSRFKGLPPRHVRHASRDD